MSDRAWREKQYGRWADDDLTFVAVRWELLEVSLVAVPQDGRAVIGSGADRAYPAPPPDPLADIRERMLIKTRMLLRMEGLPSRGVLPGQSLSLWRHPSIFEPDDLDGDGVRMPRRELLRYGDSDGGFRRVVMPPERQVDPPWGR